MRERERDRERDRQTGGQRERHTHAYIEDELEIERRIYTERGKRTTEVKHPRRNEDTSRSLLLPGLIIFIDY